MGAPAAGSVVLVPFPSSALSHAKLRPAVVLATAGKGDFVLRPGKLFTASSGLIVREVGVLQPTALDRVVEQVVALLRRSR